MHIFLNRLRLVLSRIISLGAIQSFNYDTSCDQFAVSFAPGANGRKFIVFSLYELIVDSVNGKVSFIINFIFEIRNCSSRTGFL